MCGRTSLFVARPQLEERFDATVSFAYEPRYNIAPRDPLATIRNTDTAHIVAQEWGLLADWADSPDDGPRPINARSETVAEKPMFRDAVAERRCLVPSTGFYEWQGERATKRPYRIHLADDALFAMAGIWNRWTHDGEERETVTILTTEANDVMDPIHDRMPVILPPEAEGEWLTGDVEDALSLCRPYDGDDLEAYEIETTVNDPSKDRPEIIEPAATEQTGIGEFGAS